MRWSASPRAFRDAITGRDFAAAREMYTLEKQQTVEASYIEAGWARTVANYGDYLGCDSVSVRSDGDYTVVDMVLHFSGDNGLTMESLSSPAAVDSYAYLVS